eukprot:CFRG4810T1
MDDNRISNPTRCVVGHLINVKFWEEVSAQRTLDSGLEYVVGRRSADVELQVVIPMSARDTLTTAKIDKWFSLFKGFTSISVGIVDTDSTLTFHMFHDGIHRPEDLLAVSMQ